MFKKLIACTLALCIATLSLLGTVMLIQNEAPASPVSLCDLEWDEVDT